MVVFLVVVVVVLLVFVTGETAIGLGEVMLMLVETITVALRQRL